MPSLPLLLLLALSLHASLPAARPVARSTATCSTVLPRAAPRIVGGSSATPATRAYLVALSNATNFFLCTGTLLSPRWVLTAAHCRVSEDWSARVAAPTAARGRATPIRRVYTHEWFTSGDDTPPDAPGDVALVELAEDAPKGATFVRLNVNDSAPVAGTFARAAGYGRTRRPGQDSRDPAPNQVDGPVNSPVKCAKIYKGYLKVNRRFFICVGYGKGGCQADSCHGDSGGPLVQFDASNRPVQIGIVSFGLDCGQEGVPGVYVRVSSFIAWLESKGAVFDKSSDPVAVFAEGSEEAASDEASVTVLQVLGNRAKQTQDSSQLTISKVTFAVICVVAGIALIGFIFLALFFISGRGRAGSSHSYAAHHTGADSGIPQEALSDGATRDNLQLAISLLQAISRGQLQSASNPAMHQQRVEVANTPHGTGRTAAIADTTVVAGEGLSRDT